MSDEPNTDIEIIDLDAIKPKARQVKIRGKIIDVGLIPFDVTLDIAEHYDTFAKLGRAFQGKDPSQIGEVQVDGKSIKGALELLQRCIIRVLSAADPEITEEWVHSNVSSEQMMMLIQRMIEPLMEQWGSGAQKKIPGGPPRKP